MKGEGEGRGGEGVQQPTYTLASFTVSHERGRGREGKRRQYNSQHIH